MGEKPDVQGAISMRHLVSMLLRGGWMVTMMFAVSPARSGEVRIAHLDDPAQFGEMRTFFEAQHPTVRISVVQVDGDSVLRAEKGGMRVFWIYRGEGEVFLPKGYRTQEGDGGSLPSQYVPDKVDPTFAESIRVMDAGLKTVSPLAAVPVRAVIGRLKGESFVGEYAGDLWKLEQFRRPWSTDPKVEQAIAGLFGVYRSQGFSTKQIDSYERIMEGDQVIACGSQEIRVRGRFACLAMENVERTTSHVSTARRLRFLVDSAGGCNPDFDPFRRLPLTWFANYPGETDDGLNWVNAHVVNIPKETSPAHFHPPKAIGGRGGRPQSEMYLVLDPKPYKLNTWGRTASLLVFPDLRNLSRYQEISLRPGLFIYIPPGTGHRGLDAFVNVLTLPGFKPNNEYYIDRDIRDTTGGKSPFNKNLLGAKNYERIEDLL
jgi:hypothetical protein